METLFTNGFQYIDRDMSKLFIDKRGDMLPIFVKYSGMGYYYVLFEYLYANKRNRYIILLLGGCNHYECESQFNEFIHYNGPYYTFNDCIRYSERIHSI